MRCEPNLNSEIACLRSRGLVNYGSKYSAIAIADLGYIGGIWQCNYGGPLAKQTMQEIGLTLGRFELKQNAAETATNKNIIS